MSDSIAIGFNRYGKGNVRFLRVVRDTAKHIVQEVGVVILLEGPFESAFLEGSNKSILPTETQKNTIYALAKKYSVEPIEEWCVLVAQDIMRRHSHITAVNLETVEYPWERIRVDGQEHNHAFQRSKTGARTCNARIPRNGKTEIVSGFKDLQVLKTTQSGFTGYIKDEYTTLKETTDRVFCTNVKCSWSWSTNHHINYTFIYEEIKKICLNVFAGNPTTGNYSPSVQQTMYVMGQQVLERFPEVEKISFVLPNNHYYVVNFADFKTDMTNNNEVMMTFDGPHGQIEATIERKGSPSRAKL